MSYIYKACVISKFKLNIFFLFVHALTSAART